MKRKKKTIEQKRIQQMLYQRRVRAKIGKEHKESEKFLPYITIQPVKEVLKYEGSIKKVPKHFRKTFYKYAFISYQTFHMPLDYTQKNYDIARYCADIVGEGRWSIRWYRYGKSKEIIKMEVHESFETMLVKIIKENNKSLANAWFRNFNSD